MPKPTTIPFSLIENAVRKKQPAGVVVVIVDELPPAERNAISDEPAFTEPTITWLALMSLARPIVWPAGSGTCDTAPPDHRSGSGFEPNAVVAPVPTTSPASFTPLPTQNVRAIGATGFGRPASP